MRDLRLSKVVNFLHFTVMRGILPRTLPIYCHMQSTHLLRFLDTFKCMTIALNKASKSHIRHFTNILKVILVLSSIIIMFNISLTPGISKASYTYKQAYDCSITSFNQLVNFGKADGNYANIRNGDCIKVQLPKAIKSDGTPAYDFVFYVQLASNYGIEMRWVRVLLSKDGVDWHTAFTWGGPDHSDTDNSNIAAYGRDKDGELNGEFIPPDSLYGIPPYKTGVLVDIDSIIPPGDYQYIAIDSADGDQRGIGIDAVELLEVHIPRTSNQSITPIPTVTYTAPNETTPGSDSLNDRLIILSREIKNSIQYNGQFQDKIIYLSLLVAISAVVFGLASSYSVTKSHIARFIGFLSGFSSIIAIILIAITLTVVLLLFGGLITGISRNPIVGVFFGLFIALTGTLGVGLVIRIWIGLQKSANREFSSVLTHENSKFSSETDNYVITTRDAPVEAYFHVTNINTAESDEIVRSLNINPSDAYKIIRYRKTHGYFKNKEELRKIIGEGKFQEIINQIEI